MYLFMGFEWLHIYSNKSIVIKVIPVEFDKKFSGASMLPGFGYYLFTLLIVSMNKVGIKLLLPLYLLGLYLMYFLLVDFVESHKPTVFADRIMKWIDYELLFNCYCFIGFYLIALIVSVIILFDFNKHDTHTQK